MTRSTLDLSGREFGYWTVLSKDSSKNGLRESYWLCACKCGATRSVRRSKLARGESLSCGCLSGKSKERHGLSDTREYSVWREIKKRCEKNAKNSEGGLTAKMCDSWRKSFLCFYEEMGKAPSNTHLIARNDRSIEYCKENCKWAIREKAKNTQDKLNKPKKIFNNTEHPSYTTWIQMRQRCQNPNLKKYPLYGGRGISVCERWQDFQNFCEDMGERPPGMSLDRIDTNGNYEPSNCRWATISTQNRNKRTNVWILHNGETKCLNDWAKFYGTRATTLSRWTKAGHFGKIVDRPSND
jgi:hypothetical protein